MASKILMGIILMYSFGLHSFSQNTYQVLFQNPANEVVFDMMQSDNGKIIAIGKANILDFYKYSNRGKIWQFSSPSDTLTKVFFFGDTACAFYHIEKAENNKYIILGEMYIPPLYDKTYLFILTLNESLDEIGHKVLKIDNWDNIHIEVIKKYFNSFFCFGKVSTGDVYNACIIKIGQNYNIENYMLYPEVSTSGTKYMDCILSSDSSQIWTFTDGFYGGGNKLTIYDSALNYVKSKHFPSLFDTITLNTEVWYMGNMTAKRFDDSTFLIGCVNDRIFYSQNYDDAALGFSKLDSTLSLVPITYIGSIDTNEYPAWWNTFDFKTVDSIFFTGTENQGYSFWPHQPSWIMAGMLDRNLNLKYIHYYGGDVYYQANLMKCTSDGGFVIAAQRYDYPTLSSEHDLIFLKLNKEGLIVGSEKFKECPNTIFNVQPNPATGYFILTLVTKSALLRLIDQSGQKVYEKKIYKGETLIITTGFKPGSYICEILSAQNEIFTKKLIIN